MSWQHLSQPQGWIGVIYIYLSLSLSLASSPQEEARADGSGRREARAEGDGRRKARADGGAPESARAGVGAVGGRNVRKGGGPPESARAGVGAIGGREGARAGVRRRERGAAVEVAARVSALLPPPAPATAGTPASSHERGGAAARAAPGGPAPSHPPAPAAPQKSLRRRCGPRLRNGRFLPGLRAPLFDSVVSYAQLLHSRTSAALTQHPACRAWRRSQGQRLGSANRDFEVEGGTRELNTSSP